MKKLYLPGIVLVLTFSLFFQNGYSQQAQQYLSFEQGYVQQDNTNTLPSRETANGGEDYYRISYEFSGALHNSVEVEGTKYDFLHIKGFAKMGQVGAPALPAHNEIVAMPRGASAKIVLVNTEYYEYEGFMIHPALQPATDTYGDPEPEFQIDEEIYTANEFFPKNIVEVTHVKLSRGTPLAVVQARPVQFNPVTGVIRVYTNIEYRIEYEGAAASFSEIASTNSLHYTNQLKLSVINSDNIPDGIDMSETKAGEKNYIIITHDEYLSAANDLANWKRQMGYSVEVVSQSSWTATQVKTEIENRYNAWTPKPDYFVIIGDHTGSYAVPGQIHQDPNYGDDFATDLYYACMDGGSDWHPDIANGRIPVSSLAEAQIVIDKIIDYEQTPPASSSFYDNILNCAQYQDDDDHNGYADRRFCHTSENIRDYLQDSHGYTSARVYFKSSNYTPISNLHYNNTYYSDGSLLPAELRSVSFDWAGDATDITNEIDAGKFLVFHRDHGYTGGSGWHRPYYTTSSMASLSNGNLTPVVFSMNCHTGEFQLDNCFAEKFLRMDNKGAVGVVAAAYYSYSGYNDALSLGMIDAIWADPGVYPVFGSGGTGANYTIGVGNDIYTMGDVVHQGLYAMEQNWNGSSVSNNYQYELFHYFGDPAMKIWTSDPNASVITATHTSTIDCAGTSFSVSGSTPGATATLVYNSELIGETILDGSGAGSIPYAISVPGSTLILTISKHNCKPYVASLTISGVCNFPPGVNTDAATTVNQNSATLNGEITNDFGMSVTESGFVYGTSSSPEIGGAGVTQVQTDPTVTTGTFAESVSGLSPATTYYFRAYAISAGGTGYGNDQSFTTDCGIITLLPYNQDFSTGAQPVCWSQVDHQGNGQIWEFSSTRTFNSTSNANGFAILDSDAYGSGSTQDADLITPEFDLSGYSSVYLYFEYYLRTYQTEVATVSYSINGGSTWNSLASWSSTTGNADTYNNDISAEVAGQSSVKFKWNYTGTWGYYYMIDDLSITGTETSGSNQSISLGSGWNMLSFCLIPTDPDMISIMQPLIDNSTLVKVSADDGGFVQNITGVGWMNTIGDMSNSDGYYVNLSGSDNLSTNGDEMTYPYDIPLTTGWNIMGYPCDVSQDAITVLQPLIDDGYLVKVIDEAGALIQFIAGVGWVNTITNFDPGEGYYVYVNTNCTLTLTDPSKGSSPAPQPAPMPSAVYFANPESNPFMPMNLVIRDIHTSGFEVDEGDELAVFDGDLQVGSLMFTGESGEYSLITARMDDPMTAVTDGFTEGNEFSLRFYDQSEDLVYDVIHINPLSGNNVFSPLATFTGDLQISPLSTTEPGHPFSNWLGQNYPNPFSGLCHIDYGLAEDAHVSISLYDVSGRKLKQIHNGNMDAGVHSIQIDQEKLESGIYYYRMEVVGTDSKFTRTKRMVIL